MKTRIRTVRRALGLVSFLTFPVTIFYLSPFLIVSNAAVGVIGGSFIAFAAFFASSLFLGRAYCGWLCPAGGGSDACMAVNAAPVGRRVNAVKYLIFVPWIGAIVFFFVRAGGIRGVNFFQDMPHGISLDEPWKFVIYYIVLALTMGTSLIFGRRFFCHAFCWMAPFMIVGRRLRNTLRWPALRLAANPSACEECGSCRLKCPMSLPVTEHVKRRDMEDTECILCGECVTTCPNGAIRFAFNRGPARGADSEAS